MSSSGTPGRQQVSKGLPEGYLEEFKHGIRDYFNGVIPIGLTDEDIKVIASETYHRICEHTQLTLPLFRSTGTFMMMVGELKHAGFDSLRTEKDIFRAFDSFKFHRYLRKVRKKGRAEIKILAETLAAFASQIEASEKYQLEWLVTTKERQSKIAENNRGMTECKRAIAKNDQKISDYRRAMDKNNQKLAEYELTKKEIRQKIADNEKTTGNNRQPRANPDPKNEAKIAEKLHAIGYIKRHLSPESAAEMESLWKQAGLGDLLKQAEQESVNMK